MNKSRVLIIIIAAIGLQISPLMAQESKLALGGQLVGPTGISAKFQLGSTSAITAVTSFNLSEGGNSFFTQFNYILNGKTDNMNIESGTLNSYFGLGLNARFQEIGGTIYGLRIPLGIEYQLEDQPLEIYMDMAPTLDVDPVTSFYLSSSLGARFYF